MKLLEEIEQRRREIRTDGYAMSIGEWVSMYEKNELDIHPEFQRIFRWNDIQKTNLIESILLGIPLPQIFVSQRDDGVWDVVDGLQRLSTIFQFMGILKDEKNKYITPLKLNSTKYLPSLENVCWIGDGKILPPDLQLSLKRGKLGVSIILKESDKNAKYDLFQRLNTGGSELSPQEVRNCLLIMINKKTYEWLKELSIHPSFASVTALSDKSIEQSYNLELVLRFIVLLELDESGLKKIGDVGEFLTEQITKIAQNKNFDYKSYAILFKNTFDLLERTVGESAFKRFSVIKKKHEGGFLVSQFEIVALGLAHNIMNKTQLPESKIASKIKEIWIGKENISAWTKAGITAARRVPKLIPYGRNIFKK